MVVDELKSVCKIRDNLKWFKPHNNHRKSSRPKPTKSYDGDVLTLWNEFKKLFNAKRKLDGISLSAMYCKIKSEIYDLGKGINSEEDCENE